MLRNLRRICILGLILALTACATPSPTSNVDARKVFTDPRAAALAEAATNDPGRVRELARGADLRARGDGGVTLLQWALLNRHLEGMKALLDAGADPAQPGMDGDTVVHLAAMANDAAYLKLLLERGASPNVANSESGAGPLRSAMLGRRDEQFQMLLAAGANLNLADRTGNTPLHVAGQINGYHYALALLKAGAAPKTLNSQRATFQRYLFMTSPNLLTETARKQRAAVEAWLLERGIPIEGRTK